MEQLLKQVRRARWWLGVQRFVGVLGWCLFATLSAALVLVVVDKFRPLGVEAWIWGVGSLALGLVAAIVWAAFTGRGLVDAAIELDHRCGLKERVSSSLAMSDEERNSELGQALVADAVRRIERVEVREHFGVTPSRQLLLPLVPALAVVLVTLLVNQSAVGKPAPPPPATQVQKQIQESSDSLRRKLQDQRKQAQKQGLKDAAELFRRLERDVDQLPSKTEGDRKQALVQLNDLSRELQKRRQSLGGAEELQKQFKQLKDIGQGPADKLLDEIKRGDFQKAMEQLKKLQNDLVQGNLNPDQQKQLANQLKEMQKKLKELVDAQRQRKRIWRTASVRPRRLASSKRPASCKSSSTSCGSNRLSSISSTNSPRNSGNARSASIKDRSRTPPKPWVSCRTNSAISTSSSRRWTCSTRRWTRWHRGETR